MWSTFNGGQAGLVVLHVIHHNVQWGHFSLTMARLESAGHQMRAFLSLKR